MGEVFQTLAFMELCSMASASDSLSMERRQAIFADSSGASWQIPAIVCLKEIWMVAKYTADCLSPSGTNLASAAAPAAPFPQQPRWNNNPYMAKGDLAMPDRHRDAAEWLIKSRFQRTRWAVEALADFATASAKEDSLGLLQLVEPVLWAVAQSLLSLWLVMDAHLQSAYKGTCQRAVESTLLENPWAGL